MSTEHLIDRLAFQTQALQEGFDILSKVKSLPEMAKHYCHILRGSLLTVDVNLFYKQNPESPWKTLYLSYDNQSELRENLPEEDTLVINYPEKIDDIFSIILPLRDKAQFGMILGPKIDKTPYSDFDKISLQIFLQLLDSAYQTFMDRQKEKEFVFSLNQRVLQLNSLIDTGIEISRLEQHSSLHKLALERVIALTNASRGMLRITKKSRLVSKILFPADFQYRSLEKEGNHISTNFRYQGCNYSFKLYNKESRSGFVPFDDTDQLLLDAFSRQLNVALENIYLHQEALEKQRIDQDIEVAGTIQQKIIPDQLPDIAGYDLAGINIPTKMVGGDYYDCIKLPNDYFALIIADVAGKGVPAALLVSSLHASLSAYLDNNIPLTDLASRLNKVIYNASTSDKYITFYIAILNPASGEIESLNAGHNPIYLMNDKGKIVELSEGGIPFGMMGLEFPYTSQKLTLKPGESILLYTDGVTEAMNESEEEYDDIRPLKKFYSKHKSLSAQEFINLLINDIQEFTGNTPQSDDITALFIRREADS
jgi:sigma-B regulation protein RsbU (phosphoserine phosphatase)